jgi:hypothetical protein
MKSWFKGFIHNGIVHPLMPWVPSRLGTWLHDRNADWAFGGRE